MMVGERTVLMIAAAFPPTGGPGVQRTTKFAKYLPRCGWRPIVWTVDAVDDLPQDPSLDADLPPEVVVHRVPAGGLVRRLQRRLRGVLARGKNGRVVRGLEWRLGRPLGREPMPDQFAGWVRAGVRPLCRLIEQERIDAIYSTFSPASNHVLAMKLHEVSGLPWVADFRDLWTDDYRYHETSRRRRRAHRMLEQQILETADAIVGVSERQTAILARHVPAAAAKFLTITNGFDPDDFADVWSAEAEPCTPRQPDAKFTIAHVGRLDQWRTNDALFAGLRELERRAGGHRKPAFRIVGHAAAAARQRLKQTGLACEFVGETDHRAAIREMGAADVLLLCVPDGPNGDSVIPAKVFEYLAAGRPIVMVGPTTGACADIVRHSAAGAVVPFDAVAIAAALEKALDAWRAGAPLTGCSAERLEPFSRARLARRLADLLDQLCDQNEKTVAYEAGMEVCLS